MIKKIDLIAKLIITYIVILALCFLLYALVVLPTTGAEKVNAIIGLLGWSATLFAPIAAFILINNWKEQIKHEKALECLSGVFNEISQFHFTIYYLKNGNKPEEIKRNFNSMNLEEFTIYSKEVLIEFEETHQTISNIYNSLSTLIYQYKLIFEKEDERFEYILDSYFKIHWTFLKLINDYLKYYITAKQLNQPIDFFKDHELFKAREMQLQYNKDPSKQKNLDGSYLFMSSLYLAEVKKNSLDILRNIRKEL
ncbi:hypothetical protein [Acinetobacter lactucae]|uniref:hypothetical protein n=1 Tax=Acinetobacter lactucae TaxID=1785128 RepID=UPI000707FA16|nr:hypothetical protein [Acinetobacter lactucae]KQE85719.1 hypothetical protein APB94_15560 [Acinetobacter lactucae]